MELELDGVGVVPMESAWDELGEKVGIGWSELRMKLELAEVRMRSRSDQVGVSLDCDGVGLG